MSEQGQAMTDNELVDHLRRLRQLEQANTHAMETLTQGFREENKEHVETLYWETQNIKRRIATAEYLCNLRGLAGE
jgi:2-iminoacetate synthase ThiH